MSFLVEVTGSHGVGKTTLVEVLQQFYESAGKSTVRFLGGEIARQVKEYGISINEQGTDLSQCVIFSGILDRLQSGLFDHERYIVFSDRSLVCPAAYSKVLKINDFILKTHLNMVKTFYKKIKRNNGVLFYLPIEFEIEDDGVRSTNEKFQKEVDVAIISILEEFKIPYYSLSGSVEERKDAAVNIINGVVQLEGIK